MSVEDAASHIASAIGEPARARMLFALLDGRARTSTELALVADVSPSTASAHLARLHDARLLTRHVQGRHRYYAIESRRVAAMLERLSVMAGAGSRVHRQFRSSTPDHLTRARTCYDHLAGALGVALHDALLARDWLRPAAVDGDGYTLTDAGQGCLTSLGIDVDAAQRSRRRFAYGCLDWSERRPHLGGALAAALLGMMLERRWMKRDRHSRGLELTALGRRELAARLGLTH